MSWDVLGIPEAAPEQDPTWGDYGKAAASTATGIAAGTTGLLRQYFEAGQSPNAAGLFRELQSAARSAGDDIDESMSKSGRERLNAGVTSPEFWAHPASSLALKATGMTPYLLASAIPGALVSDGVAAMAATTAAGGVLSAGDLVDEITKKPDQMSDADLKKIPLYATLREDMDEEEAREKYNRVIVGAKPALAFALGAGEGLFGPVGNIMRGVKGVGAAGRHGIGKAALEGGASELADEGGAAVLAQSAEIEGGTRKDYDPKEILDRGLTGMVLGAGFGGVSGIGGGHGKGKAKADEIRNKGAGEGDAEVSAATLQEQVAAGQEGGPAAPAKAASEKAFGVDPTIKAAMDAKAEESSPKAAEAPEVPVPAPRRPPPTAEQVFPQSQPAATPPAPNAQQETPSPAAQPQRPPSAEQQTAAAAPVTSGVTPPSQLTDAQKNALVLRGLSDEEIANPKLTPDLADHLIKTLPDPTASAGGSAQTPSNTPNPPSAPPAAAQTEQVPTARAATQTAAPQSDVFGEDTPRAPGEKRVLQNISPEAQANAAATQAALKKNVGDVAKAGQEKAPTVPNSNKGKARLAAMAARAEKAKAAHAKYTAEPLPTDTPDSKEKRAALAAKLKGMIDDSGFELRENLPEHILNHFSVPKDAKAAGKTGKDFPVTSAEKARYDASIPENIHPSQSEHVRYIREMAGIVKALEGGREFAVTDKGMGRNLRRTLSFVTAHNSKANDLIAQTRKEAGHDIEASKRGATVEQSELSTTKGTVATAQKTGAVKGSEQTLGDNAKAAIGAEVLERERQKQAAKQAAADELARPVGQKTEVSKETPAEISETPPPKLTKVEQAKQAAKTLADKYAAKAETPPPAKKPKLTPTVATLVAKTKPEPKEDAPLPRKTYEITEIRDDMHEGYKPVAEALNTVRRWVNGLSDEDYAKLSRKPLLMMSDAASVDTVHKIGKWFKEDLKGRDGPFDGDEKIAAVAKAQQDELVKDVVGEKVTPEVTKKAPEKATGAAALSEKAQPAAPKISDKLVEAYAATRDISIKEARAELEAAAAKEDTANAPLDAEELQYLSDMGYTDAAIKKLGPKQARYNLEEGIQPADAPEATGSTSRERAPSQKEIDADEHREALLAKIEREEKEREDFIAKTGKAPVRPAASQAATAEELKELGVPTAASAPVAINKRSAAALSAAERAALAEKIQAKRREGGILKIADDDLASMSDDDLIALANTKARPVTLAMTEHDIWDTPIHKARDIFGHGASSLSEGMSARDVLNDLDLEHLPELPKYLQGFTRRRLAELLGNIKIYIASPELVRDADGGSKPPGGYYHPGGAAGQKDYIVINSDSMKTRQRYAHVVIHEALHAALYNQINADPRLRSDIQTLMGHLKSELAADTSMRGTANLLHAKYAMKDVHEFISEALSNPRLQEIMSKIAVPPEMARSLGVGGFKPKTMWTTFVEKVRKTLGLQPGTHNLLHETLKAVQPALDRAYDRAVTRGDVKRETADPLALSMDALRDAAVGVLPNADTRTNAKGKLSTYKDAVSRAWDLTRRGRSYFGENNPLYRLFETKSMMERAKKTILDKYGGLEAAAKVAIAERLHPEAMAKGKAVLLEMNLHDISADGDNSHLGKTSMMGVQPRKELAGLLKAWNDPTINPVRKTLLDAAKFFKDIHNATSRQTIDNVLAEAGIHDPAMAERIHNEGLNEADREKYKDTKLVKALDNVQALKRKKGTYIPFRRFGDFVSTANHELSVPANAIKTSDNTLQFVDPNPKNGTEYGDKAARDAATRYLESNSHTPQGNKLTPVQVRRVWVDRNNPSETIEAEDPNAIVAYRVSMQTQHTEMHATRAEAENSKAALAEAGLVGARAHSREDAYNADVGNLQSAMGTVLRSLEKQQRYKDADSTQRAAMREMFHDLTLGLSGTTSIKNSMRHRRNVAGMSQDLGRVLGDYSRMTANHLAMLQYRPKLDAIFKEMRDYKDAHQYDKDSIRRDEIYKEFVNRIYGKAADRADAHTPGAVSRVIQMTRLSFLAGPSFHIINGHEPWTTALPVIAGDHGFARTTRAMADAYSLIGGRAGLMAGLKDTAAAFTKDVGFTDYVKLFKDTIGKSKAISPDTITRLQDLLDYADARNLFSNSAIFEAAKFANPESGVFGKTLDRADLMANQVGSAIEAINRSVTLIPAYRLEYQKNGGNHQAAMQYAFSRAQETMGDYSAWNAAPVFNTKYGKPLLQFKKFPQKMYMLLGNIMGGVLRGDPAAMKQFVGLMVTHGLVAGALGLPTEPMKLALIAANALGVTGFTPDDYEYAVRQLAARVAGQKGGEIISKGLYRGIGIEASGRFGLNDLAVRGHPKSQKDSDIKSFLFDTMGGASASFLLNQMQAGQALMKGDVAGFVEKASPLRTVGDIAKAFTGASGDKVSDSGKVLQGQYGVGATAARILGFQPSSVAENYAKNATEAREVKKLGSERSGLIQARLTATGGKIVDAQRAIQEFNSGKPREQQISSKDIAAARTRRENINDKPTSGRNKAIYEQTNQIFNP